MPYSIFQKNNTDEYHLYEATGIPGNCIAQTKSICEKASKTESTIRHSCLTDDQARRKAAEIGHSFCGTCVSHLYKTY